MLKNGLREWIFFICTFIDLNQAALNLHMRDSTNNADIRIKFFLKSITLKFSTGFLMPSTPALQQCLTQRLIMMMMMILFLLWHRKE